MNTNKNPNAVTEENTGKTKVKPFFCRSGLPKYKRRRAKRFSKGYEAGQNWFEWIKKGDNEISLRETYCNAGVCGVMSLLKLGKSQAYELIGALDWRREKIAKDNLERAKQYGNELFRKRRRHLREHYGWIPGMNCCFLKSFEKFYKGHFQVGGKQMGNHCWMCVSSLPFVAVRNYMKKHGLLYYVTKYGVFSVGEVPDTRVTLITTREHASGPITERGQWANAEVENLVSLTSQYPSPEEEKEEERRKS